MCSIFIYVYDVHIAVCLFFFEYWFRRSLFLYTLYHFVLFLLLLYKLLLLAVTIIYYNYFSSRSHKWWVIHFLFLFITDFYRWITFSRQRVNALSTSLTTFSHTPIARKSIMFLLDCLFSRLSKRVCKCMWMCWCMHCTRMYFSIPANDIIESIYCCYICAGVKRE